MCIHMYTHAHVTCHMCIHMCVSHAYVVGIGIMLAFSFVCVYVEHIVMVEGVRSTCAGGRGGHMCRGSAGEMGGLGLEGARSTCAGPGGRGGLGLEGARSTCAG